MNKKIISVVAIIAIVAILGVMLVACNAESYTKKLERAGYTVTSSESSEKEEGIVWTVTGAKSTGLISGQTVNVTKYAKVDDAKEAEETAITLLGEDRVARIGSILIVGSNKDAVKDAK